MGTQSGNNSSPEEGGAAYIGNIWGRKWTIVSLIVVLFFLGLATCRYLVIKPDRLIIPEKVKELE